MMAFHFHGTAQPATKKAPFRFTNQPEDTITADQRDHRRTSRSPYRLMFLTVLFLMGLFVLGTAGGRAASSPRPAASHPIPIAAQQHQLSTQAGREEGASRSVTTPAICLPTDLQCLLNQAAQWLAKALFSVIQPIVDTIDRTSLNFITQTRLPGPMRMQR
jgi:hypothetical protein